MNNITISKANIFFNGNVTNRDISTNGVITHSLGIMLPGQYKWQTDNKETFYITQGLGTLKINDDIPQKLSRNAVVTVPDNSVFEFDIHETIDYEVRY